MLNVSNAYKQVMNSTIRPRAYQKIKLRVLNMRASKNNTITSTSTASFSNMSNLCIDTITPKNTYSTLEIDRFILDGSQLPVPDNIDNIENFGWISQNVSNTEGNISDPAIDIIFDQEYNLSGLCFEFDAITGDYISEMCISAFHADNSVAFLTITILPSSTSYVFNQKLIGVKRLEFSIQKTSRPYRRARINKILLGVIHTYDNTDLSASSMSTDLDPLSRHLPIETMSFSVLDIDHSYDPDDPTSLWEYIDSLSPISISYGRALSANQQAAIEWLPEIIYLLDGKPSKKDKKITFTAHRKLHTLNSTYYKSVFNSLGATLYDLAENVLMDALGNDNSLWYIDNSLHNIISKAILPVMTHRECLQLIANAGQCILYTDNNGKIILKRGFMPTDVTGISYSAVNAPLNKPILKKSNPLSSVIVQRYQYNIADNSSVLYRSEIAVNGLISLHVNYRASTEQSITVTGGEVIDYTLYASAADIMISASETVALIITGKLVEQLSVQHSYQYNQEGEINYIDNPLITDVNNCKCIADYQADYLQLRSIYTLSTRGNPELETNDAVTYVQNLSGDLALGLILKTIVTFDNGTSGEVILKRLSGISGTYAYTNEIYCGERGDI